MHTVDILLSMFFQPIHNTMINISFNHDWHFTFAQSLDAFNHFGMDKYTDAVGAPARWYDHDNWQQIDLPHDWAVALPKNLAANTFAGGRANSHFHRFTNERHNEIAEIYSVGWYRKTFDFDPAWTGKRIFIEFEGIFRDAMVWVNGCYLDRHNSGYTGFILELTDHLVPGTDNSIAVRVDSDQPEGWWYEGAGIYRNVNLLIAEQVGFKYHQTVVKTALDGTVTVRAILQNETVETVMAQPCWTILNREGEPVATASAEAQILPYAEAPVTAELHIACPHLWHVDDPYLYTLQGTLGGERETIPFGVRTVAFDPDRGFLLNGRSLKVRGACVHQDFGGVGVALTDNLQYYKIRRLKEMGVNAYRAAHHAPAPALLRACDELGMLVMDETRMFGTSPEAIRQLTDLIERDRNHPSVFIWSLGNEEFSVQNLPWSAALMAKMTRLAKALDDTRPVSYGGNNGANFDGANRTSEVRGVNYIRNSKTGFWLDQYHADHPHQPIIGTEESSYVLSRSGSVNDLGAGKLDSTGQVTMPWGSTPKGWVKYCEERPYFAGSFMWTGFDYRGEPNPFITANVASSFGTIDLCGMEKPPFYYYKAWWTDEPVLKLTPHWNHREGETVTLAVFTNCETVTLSCNGRVVETRQIERFDAPLFTLPYVPGTVTVEGVRKGVTFRDELHTAGKTAGLRITPILPAERRDEIAIYQLEAFDAEGRFCPTAAEWVQIRINGGRIVGVGNGDPADLDDEQPSMREDAIFLRTFNTERGMYTVPQKAPNLLRLRHDWIEREETPAGFADDFRLVARYQDDLAPAETMTLTTTFTGAENYQYVEFERLGGAAEVWLNGERLGDNRRNGRISLAEARPYRFRCRFREGENVLKVVTERKESSQLPISGYVKIGRLTPQDATVRLHGGLARVFVCSETPEAVELIPALV